MRRRTAAARITAAGIAVLIAIAAFISPPTVAADPIKTTAVVLKVVDGDTIDIHDDIRGRLRIRVLGIFPVK